MRSITLEDLDEMRASAEHLASELEGYAAAAGTADRQSLRMAEAHALALADELRRLRAPKSPGPTEMDRRPVPAA